MTQNKSSIPEKWLQKRYFSLDAYCKDVYHEKIYKIAIDAGLTCPNRDGTLDTRGCIFCSAGGSGDFAVLGTKYNSVTEQIEAGKAMFGDKKIGTGFIAYFQAYTNTYGDIDYLKSIFEQALSHPDIRGISIATRPDCLPPQVLSLLKNLKQNYPDKFIWVELGLQTIHESTAVFIRRGYELPVFEKAVLDLSALKIPTIVHVILGLPKEAEKELLETIAYLNALPISGIKLQLLHIIENTDLALLYKKGEISVLSLSEYVNLLILALEHLSPDIVVHRITGDGPKDITLAPTWSFNKRMVLNTISHELSTRNTMQGRCYHGETLNRPV